MKYFILACMISLGFQAQAQVVQRAWDSELGRLELQDDPSLVGEESLLWITEGQNRMAKIDEVSGDNFTGSYMVARAGGAKVMDVTLNLILDESFRQTLPLLKDSAFRKAFKAAPESCPEKADGLLILSDNLKMHQSIYCLLPL